MEYHFFISTYSESVQACLSHLQFTATETLAATEAVYKGTSYSVGSFVPVSVNEELCVGEIRLLLLQKRTNLFVVLKLYNMELLPQLHCYSVLSEDTFLCKDIDHLVDYYPLPAYDVRGHLVIVPKHWITL